MNRAPRLERLKGYLRSLPTRTKFLLLLPTDLWVMRSPVPSGNDAALLVRLDAIGDFVLWIDAAQALVKWLHGQGKRVVLAANASWAAWAEDLQIFDQVFPIDTREYQRNPGYRASIGKQIRALGCSVAINTTYSRTWLLGDSVVRVSGARERIGSIGDRSNCNSWQMKIADGWYTRLVAATPEPITELERNAEFFRNLADSEFKTRIPKLPPSGTVRDEAFDAEIKGRPYFVVFPGAGWRPREWPPEKFAKIIDQLCASTGWLGVICGGRADAQLAASISRLAESPLLDWTGRTNLRQLTEILRDARFLLTNETSAAHIAATQGTPTVCVIGGGHFGRFLPYKVDEADGRPLPHIVSHSMPCFGCNWQCIYKASMDVPGPVPCIEQISTESVWDETREVLAIQ